MKKIQHKTIVKNLAYPNCSNSPLFDTDKPAIQTKCKYSAKLCRQWLRHIKTVFASCTHKLGNKTTLFLQTNKNNLR